MLPRARVSQWLGWLPGGHPLRQLLAELEERVGAVQWSVGDEPQRRAALLGLRLVLAGGYRSIREITHEDLKAVPVAAADGIDVLDAVLCQAGALGRTPLAGELVAGSRIPERLRAAHQLYLGTYAQRISDVYATTRLLLRARARARGAAPPSRPR
jgi:hypothetical protein